MKNNNELIVEGREVGKTTFLLSAITNLKNKGYNIFVLDSATEHEDKSLLKKVVNTYSNAVVLTITNEKQIILDKIDFNTFVNNYRHYFPFNEVSCNLDKTICFDLSYFLELGHTIYDNFSNKELYKYYRKLYNTISEQIVLTLILMEKDGIIKNSVVVMDEIELPINNNQIELLQKNLHFIAAVHPENAFGSFYQTFKNIHIKSYLKRKDN